MNNKYKQYSETNFPERLFVLGASPSLELLYPYREEMNEWGHWAIIHPPVTRAFLEYINPLYLISYTRCGLQDKAYAEICLNNPLGNVTYGASIGGFISQFEKFGGKELFLFGYQGGVPSGYWRAQPLDTGVTECPAIYTTGGDARVGMNPEKHLIDCDNMNKDFATRYTGWRSLKLYHLGKTRYNFMTKVSTKELMELI